MRTLSKIGSVLCLLLLTACVEQIPPLNYSPPNIGFSNAKLDGEVRSITVSLARPDEKTGEFADGVGPHTSALWKDALQEALDRMAIFRDDAPKKLSIAIKILQHDLPAIGASFTSNSTARYEIIDRSNGDIIYSVDINSSGTVPGDYAFAGIIRAREALNRSAQNNIIQFLQALETVDLNRPMFPSGK